MRRGEGPAVLPLPLLNDVTLLAALQAAGAEAFDTGHATPLLGTFEDEYLETAAGAVVVSGRTKTLRCRASDVAARRLVKESPVRRIEDGSVYFVKELKPDAAGLTQIVLRI